MSSIITKIEAFRVPPRWLFVRVETTAGIVGWGEATLEGHTQAVEGALEDLIHHFVGWDADNIQDIWQTAYRARFYRGGPVLMSALSGLDIALWDIKGKNLGVPVWQLLGGKVRDRVKVYGWIGGDSPSDVFNAAMERKSQGFTAVKMNATDSIAWLDSPSVLTDAVARIEEVKRTGLDVGLDFHGRLHKGMAKQLAKLLEPHMPLFIEEPLLPTQPEEIADLSRLVSTPIALGERLYARSDFRPYLEKRAIDIAQPDVSHCGGISELHRIASLTETYDVGLAPHCPLGPIALAACMQVAISAPNFVIQEMSWKIHYNVSPESDQEADLYTYLSHPSVFEIKEGHLGLLHGPGIGIEINEQLVRETSANYTSKHTPWKNPVWRGEDGFVRECQPNTQVRVKYLRLRDLSNVPRPQTSMLYQEIDQVENTPTQGQTIGNRNEPLSVGGYPWEARALNKTHKSCCIQSTRATTIVPFGVTYEKIGTIQRRLAWPLHKDDTLSRSGRPTGLNIYFLVSRGLRIRPECCTHSCIGTHEVRLSTLERFSILDTSQ